MNEFEIKAFFKKYGFLTHQTKDHEVPIVEHPESVEEVKIRFINDKVLNERPFEDVATGSLVGIDDCRDFYLLDLDGQNITIVKCSISHVHNEAYTDNHSSTGETIGEALLRCDDISKVGYIVKKHTGYSVEDHHSVGGYSVTIYLPSKHFSLKGWFDNKAQEAEKAISQAGKEI